MPGQPMSPMVANIIETPAGATQIMAGASSGRP